MTTQPEPTRSINPFIGLLVLGLIVAAIWIWNHLTFDTQDYITDDILPILGVIVGLGVGLWVGIKKWRVRKERHQLRDRLLQRFQKEPSPQKRRDLAFALIEVNQFEAEGLDAVTEPMAELFIWHVCELPGNLETSALDPVIDSGVRR